MGFKGTFLLLGYLTLWATLSTVLADLGVCRLPPDGGLCFILQERWFYNMDSRQCEPFNYGGCAGNENNFKSREQCETACAHYGELQQRGCLGQPVKTWVKQKDPSQRQAQNGWDASQTPYLAVRGSL
ncbi:hypothetical protein lerEdw1_005008 [Lerista edwardsae]|nr:hypothetical protein lerEdw1_005008 [Lerista edwardsae]